MPAFLYKAARSDGQVVEGVIEASDRQDAAHLLRNQGQTPIQLRPESQRPARHRRWSDWKSRSRLGEKDIELFTLQLATLLDAGLTLTQALHNISGNTDTPSIAKLAREIGKRVQHGESLSEALRQSDTAFDDFYLATLRAGEVTGATGQALLSLAHLRERNREMREALISSLIYPALLLLLALGAMILMLIFVVPQFTALFTESGQSMPLLTRIVAATGGWLASWWWLILGGVAATVYGLKQYWKDKRACLQRDRRVLELPLFGLLWWKLDTARFVRTLSSLLKNGINLLPALNMASATVTNTHIHSCLRQATTRVSKGESLARALQIEQALPSLAQQLIQTGEQTDRLVPLLAHTAKTYEHEVERSLKRSLQLIEPIIIILIAVLTSIIILSLVMLILSSNDLIL